VQTLTLLLQLRSKIGFQGFAGLASCRLAGGGPAATHFSCLAKKSKQKKATADAALRVPVYGALKMGNEINSLRSNIFHF
jgi:hypothetical protein